MHAIEQALAKIQLADAIEFQNLTMTPLLAESDTAPDYITLDDALAQEGISITEMSESGSVPELRLENRCDQAVLLLDGEELVGAKQNRVLNLTILAPAKSTLVIPVSCVEQGRWSRESAEFSTKGHTLYGAGRARKASQVTQSLRHTGTHRSDQGALWEEISEKFARMDSASNTEAMSGLYADYGEQIEAYHNSFQAQEQQAGAVFSINGQVRGLDLFDSPAIFKKMLPKLVRSYALDAIDEGKGSEAIDGLTVADLLGCIAGTEATAHLAIGEGEDIRISGSDLAGGALFARERIVHLCVFRIMGSASGSDRSGSGLARSTRRMAAYRR